MTRIYADFFGSQSKRRELAALHIQRRLMTDDPLERLMKLYCAYCLGTGMMELIMRNQSRESWPCMYCEAGRRVRDACDAAKLQAGSELSEIGEQGGTES
jgi:hypothetical protein